MIHAGAFGLFLVSVLLILVATVFDNLYPDSQAANVDMNIALLIYFVLAFFSQCCICFVFWQLGEKIEPAKSVRNADNSYPQIILASFDGDAELQARLWNQFVRAVAQEDDNLPTDQSMSVVVTYQDILASKDDAAQAVDLLITN